MKKKYKVTSGIITIYFKTLKEAKEFIKKHNKK